MALETEMKEMMMYVVKQFNRSLKILEILAGMIVDEHAGQDLEDLHGAIELLHGVHHHLLHLSIQSHCGEDQVSADLE